MSKNKNISKVIKIGTIVRTRDEYFQGSKKYRKPNYQFKGNYRPTVVIDSNKDDELALVKQTKTGRGDISVGNKKYRSRIETRDSTGKPIKESAKFIIKRDKQGNIKESISERQANKIKILALTHPKDGIKNKKSLQKLKKR